MSTNPWFRQLVKQTGLPLPTPQKLRRPDGPWAERPLADRRAVVWQPREGALAATLAETLTAAGADPTVVGGDEAPWRRAGEAYGRPPQFLAADATPTEDARADLLLFDGTALRDPADLRQLYDFFHAWLPTLRANGRVLVLGRPAAEVTNANAAAAAAALEGFARSVAKEVGRKGATAHVIFVSDGAEDRLAPVARWLLSDRSAFVTGQPWFVSARAAAPEKTPLARVLEGKVALVTGAARGIGAATARCLAAEGAHVICLDRPADDGPNGQVAREIGGTPLSVDITDAEAPQAIVAALGERGVDVVIHNAGITRDKTLARMTPEWWDQAVEVNLGAVTRITGALLERGLRDGGRVVCLSSVAGIAGNAGQTNYSASKAGLVGYVRALAGPLAGRGITINAVAPGFIETRLTAAMPVVNREVARRLSALGQGGEPRDVAEALTFLSSPGASGITGNVVRVCGGMFIGA
jgi:3-oxoacyl-[acyl-carrier protein] reductase